MINTQHLKELTKRRMMMDSSYEPSEKDIEVQINTWVKTHDSIENVYKLLCDYLGEIMKSGTGNERFNNATIGKKCDCGAKYTSFPNFHSEWCSAFRS